MDRDLKTELTGLAIGVAGVLLFALIVEEVDRFEEAEGLIVFDVIVAQWVADHVPQPVFEAGLVLARVGSIVVVGPLLLAAAAFAWWRGHRTQAAAIVAGAVLLQLAVLILKWFFGRPRPDVGLAESPGLSFPSGHSAFGAYLASVAAWFTIHRARRRAWTLVLLGLAGTWALLQAAGRVVIGVHYVSDVLAGLGIGFAVGGFGLAAIPVAQRAVRLVRLTLTVHRSG